MSIRKIFMPLIMCLLLPATAYAAEGPAPEEYEQAGAPRYEAEIYAVVEEGLAIPICVELSTTEESGYEAYYIIELNKENGYEVKKDIVEGTYRAVPYLLQDSVSPDIVAVSGMEEIVVDGNGTAQVPVMEASEQFAEAYSWLLDTTPEGAQPVRGYLTRERAEELLSMGILGQTGGGGVDTEITLAEQETTETTLAPVSIQPVEPEPEDTGISRRIAFAAAILMTAVIFMAVALIIRRLLRRKER